MIPNDDPSVMSILTDTICCRLKGGNPIFQWNRFEAATTDDHINEAFRTNQFMSKANQGFMTNRRDKRGQ
jgi:hypothetical protein